MTLRTHNQDANKAKQARQLLEASAQINHLLAGALEALGELKTPSAQGSA